MIFNFLNPIRPGLFWFFKGLGGGADLPPPSKNGCNGWEVQKLSWNLISYQDWCQTWGFTTFRNLEPPELMVWKSHFFRPSMRFVRVPPYESWANWTNFCSSWENGDFLEGQKCCILFHTQNEEKSKKISTCIRIHTLVCAKTWWWGQICPPPSQIGLIREKQRAGDKRTLCGQGELGTITWILNL